MFVGSSHGLAACLVELVDRDGPPDFSWSDRPMLRWWWSDRVPGLSRPPSAPMEMFDAGGREVRVVDWDSPTWLWQAFGRVSPQVKELFAVIPGGEAMRVAVGATGAFALSWSRTVATFGKASHRPPLSLFARDSAGRVLSSMTLP
ncbi:hypothetical protein [Frankia sp. AgKG'84/4]|uniref:hypothetical protein n=1 Tax=Frankia sp. AgKG'84/4 TaxID=573490 RepID=UPI00201052E6|nr:hypothetical protein [Frankia sp. AgKG'84/4]MCL9796831.1 hypothetical protein [Frankia sp. AgKG'84/4]